MRGNSPIWRALDRARAFNLAARGEAPARPGPDGVTRRRVLAGLGAGMGAALLPRFPAFAAAPAKVAVIGGGLAGLTALDRLRAHGVDATLFEARGAVGGRTRSVRGVFAPDMAFDEGAQLVNTDHVELIQLIGRLGLRLVDRQAYGDAVEAQIGADGRLVDEAALAEALRPIAAIIGADADRLDRDYDTVSREIDRESVAAYLDRHGLARGDARTALEAAIRTEYGVEPDEASALELMFNLPTVDCERVHRISLSDERYLVDGGTGRIAEALAAPLAGHIRLGKRLTALAFDPAGARLRFDDGETASFDRVILALPAPLLREVAIEGPLPSDWRALFDEIALGRNEKLIVGYGDQGWRRDIGFGGGVWADAGFAALWDATSGRPGPVERPGALTYFLGGAQVEAARDVPAAELARRFHRVAAGVLPSLGEPSGLVRRTRWSEDPLSQGAYVNFRPGQLSRFGHLLTLEDEEAGTVRPSGTGPLFFAGEWLSDAWQGYMVGAVQTGRIAADAAMMPAEARAAA